MFGKRKMSSTDRFVMSKGKQAGNFGNHKGPAGKSGKAGPNPFRMKKASKGTAGPVKLVSS